MTTPPTDTGQSQRESESETLAARLGRLLEERGQTVAIAEGATGGALAHALTQVPGSSAWFRAGIVAYTDYPKQLLLRVATETIDERGSISAEATMQMARLARRLFATDWSIAVTGYADRSVPATGPRAPGIAQTNPVGVTRIDLPQAAPHPGLTYIAVSGVASNDQGDHQSWEERLLPAEDRTIYKEAAVATAIETLITAIEG